MKVRVLIVEDEKLIRWSLRQKLEAHQFSVKGVENGEQAFAAFNAGTFDLILLDYKLPDTTGLDILRKIRETDEDVVVIMMTAHSSIESAVDAIKLGAYDYITNHSTWTICYERSTKRSKQHNCGARCENYAVTFSTNTAWIGLSVRMPAWSNCLM